MQRITVLATYIAVFFGCLMIMTSSACGQRSIVNRWQAAGRLEKGRIVPHKSKLFEYEFLKNGIFNIYSNGAIIENGNYIMASDKRSLLLKDVNRRNQTIVITKLTASELNIIPTRGDTIICYTASFMQRQPQSKNVASHKQANKDWVELQKTYKMLNDFLDNYCRALLASSREAKSMVAGGPLSSKTISDDIVAEVQYLTKQDIESYIQLMDKMATRLPDFCEDVKTNMPSSYDKMTKQFSSLAEQVKRDKEKFIKSFKAYTGESLVFPVYEMPKSMKSQLSVNSDTQAEKEWNNVRRLYKSRDSIIVDVVNSLNEGKAKDSSMYLRYIEAIELAERYNVEFRSLTKQNYEQYTLWQEDMSGALEDFKIYIEDVKYQGKQIPSPYKEWLPQLAALENALAEANKRFSYSYESYLKKE